MCIEKDKERLAVLARIDEYERKRWFNKDVENDPPTIPLTADKVDYLQKKLKNKILSRIKNGQLVIKEVKGIENFEKLLDQGVILTCNHFNAFDNFAIHNMVHPYIGTNLYKVIREGNFTSFPGLFGLFFRHCNTLPLSSNFSCMKLFIDAVATLLKKKQKILIYAEQGMWWNYRKPRPLTNGAFNLAVNSMAPVLPIFITMEDTDKIGGDGFPIQAYTINVLEPIYPDPNKSRKENIDYMRDKNYQMWKEVYEKFYGIPLEYLPEEK